VSVSEKEKASYSISEAAKLLRISVGMLREYERRGLIKPHRNPKNNYRLFSKADLEWIRCLRELIHRQGLSIEGVQRLLTVMPCWEIKKCSEREKKRCLVFPKERGQDRSSAGKKFAGVMEAVRAAGSALGRIGGD
jgi:MerR family transcriptional regulator/heat shock protein HspR